MIFLRFDVKTSFYDNEIVIKCPYQTTKVRNDFFPVVELSVKCPNYFNG